MSIEVIFAILAVALVLFLLSAFPATRYILWESVLHPFRKDGTANSDEIGRDSVGRTPREVVVHRPRERSEEEFKEPPRQVAIHR